MLLVQIGALLLVISSHTAALSQKDSLVDVFPLKRGLHCIYQYEHQYYSSVYGTDYSEADSGTIEYVILDSSRTGDTIITWNVREIRQLRHHLVQNVPVLDTTYSTADSATTSLIESITGHHELHYSSLIWDFPVVLQFLDTIQIDRFADSAQLLLTRSANICVMIVPPFTDNHALFSSDSGLIILQKYFCFENDPNPSYNRTDAALISRIVTGVKEGSPQPTHFSLNQNYSNPFNPFTTISYTIPKHTQVRLQIFNPLGQLITTLVDESKPPGTYTATWVAGTQPSGLYFYRMTAGEFGETKKAILLK